MMHPSGSRNRSICREAPCRSGRDAPPGRPPTRWLRTPSGKGVCGIPSRPHEPAHRPPAWLQHHCLPRLCEPTHGRWICSELTRGRHATTTGDFPHRAVQVSGTPPTTPGCNNPEYDTTQTPPGVVTFPRGEDARVSCSRPGSPTGGGKTNCIVPEIDPPARTSHSSTSIFLHPTRGATVISSPPRIRNGFPLHLPHPAPLTVHLA